MLRCSKKDFAQNCENKCCNSYIYTMRILMVCLGNICRSPMAAGIANALSAKHQLGWLVDSAGASGEHDGEGAHRLAVKVCKNNGIDISEHISKRFRKVDIAKYNRIYVMDKNNLRDVKVIAGDAFDDDKIDFLLNDTTLFPDPNVPDPWYGGEQDFVQVFDLLTKACEQLRIQLQP
ncbi:MAG: low molecular weight phosphotyrosine protein phosphatase [Bacteroidetes bacterium]|nr:MAG: low molecular weight phosphotyrosine protein phosphatase [Bacteroidota bacterium]